MATLRDQDFENVDPGEARVWLPGGIYLAKVLRRDIKHYSWGEKLIFDWAVHTSKDLSQSETLHGYYNVKRNGGNRLCFGPGHAYRRDWIAANEGKLPSDPKRLPPAVFYGKVLLVAVVTVEKDTRGPIHPSCHWSKVARVIRPVEDGETFERLPLELDNT